MSEGSHVSPTCIRVVFGEGQPGPATGATRPNPRHSGGVRGYHQHVLVLDSVLRILAKRQLHHCSYRFTHNANHMARRLSAFTVHFPIKVFASLFVAGISNSSTLPCFQGLGTAACHLAPAPPRFFVQSHRLLGNASSGQQMPQVASSAHLAAALEGLFLTPAHGLDLDVGFQVRNLHTQLPPGTELLISVNGQ